MFDANVSVRLYWGVRYLGKKVEVKNMNSFRNVARAIEPIRKAGFISFWKRERKLCLRPREHFTPLPGNTGSMRTKERSE